MASAGKMSDHDDQLPDTHDPFELLGVASDVDARGLKRAYVRRLKVFRPDGDPEAFRRVRAAYEEARSCLEAGSGSPIRIERPPVAPRTDKYSDVSSSPPSSEEGWKPSSSASEEGSAEPSSVSGEGPSVSAGGEGSASSASASEKRDEAASAWVELEDWIRALDAGFDVGDHVQDFREEWVPSLVAARSLTWSKLRRQADRSFAVWLYRSGLECRGRSRETSEILDELSSEDLLRDVLETPELERVIWQGLSLAVWDDEARARALLDTYPSRPGDESPEFEGLELTLYLLEEWKTVRSLTTFPDTFESVLRYGSLFDSPDDALCLDVTRDVFEHPEAWMKSLDLVAGPAPTVTYQIQAVADAWEAPDDRLWDELSPAERNRMSGAIDELNRALDRNPLNALLTALIGVGLIVAVPGFFWWGWWGLLSLGGIVVLLLIQWWLVDGYLYRRVMRPILRTRFVEVGISPDRVVEAIAANTRWDDDVGRFTDEVSEDVSLAILAAFHRIRAARTLRSGSGDEEPKPNPALRDRCPKHPENDSWARCAGCQRDMCSECTASDSGAGDHCVDCHGEQLAALRRRCAPAEKGIRNLGAFCIFVAGISLLPGAGMVAVGKSGAWVFFAVAVFYLGVGVGTLLRLSGARYLLMLACGLALTAFPLGTIWGALGLARLTRPEAAIVFSSSYEEVRRTPPKVPMGWTPYVYVLASTTMILVALAMVTGLVRP